MHFLGTAFRSGSVVACRSTQFCWQSTPRWDAARCGFLELSAWARVSACMTCRQVCRGIGRKFLLSCTGFCLGCHRRLCGYIPLAGSQHACPKRSVVAWIWPCWEQRWVAAFLLECPPWLGRLHRCEMQSGMEFTLMNQFGPHFFQHAVAHAAKIRALVVVNGMMSAGKRRLRFKMQIATAAKATATTETAACTRDISTCAQL